MRFARLTRALKNSKRGKRHVENLKYSQRMKRHDLDSAEKELTLRNQGKSEWYEGTDTPGLKKHISKRKSEIRKYQKLIDQGYTPKDAMKELGWDIAANVAAGSGLAAAGAGVYALGKAEDRRRAREGR
jgi:hypothetical protein